MTESDPKAARDLELLAEQLAGDEAAGNQAEDSTARALRAELETLASDLRRPVPADQYDRESAFQRGLDIVKALGRDPSFVGEPQKSVELSPPADLGTIREYQLLAKLGEGGMGAVYKALHRRLDKVVALKILPADRLQNSGAVQRFEREMKAVGKLDHPNIIRAMDAGDHEGRHYLVMELVEGIDLSELLRRVGALDPADACELIRQAANGLQHSHQRGLVHRDIKPSNLMLTWSDEFEPCVKILDMGLALLSESKNPAQGELTNSGQLMGTVEYMSPEQGLDTHNVDIRSDIYSLGATLYKLLTGTAPFSGARYNTPGKILVAQATEKPASVSAHRDDLPAGLATVVDRLLAKDPAERFATPAEVARVLVPFAVGADLRRLADTARQSGTQQASLVAKSVTPTDEYLSSPNTGTVTEAPPAAEDMGAVRGSPDRECAVRGSPDPAPPDLQSAARGTVGRPATALALAVRGSPDPALTGLPVRGSPDPAPTRRRVAILTAVGLLLVGLIGLLFGGQIIRIITNHGQIVIATDGDGIEVVIKDGTGKVLDTETKREITFKAGEYNIEVTVTDSAGEQRFVTDHFTLTRGGRKVVDARWEVAQVKAAAELSDPDRNAAEWALSIGGSIRVKENGGERPVTEVGELPLAAFELTHVDLTGREFTDAGMSHFQGCRNITHLNLYGCAATDACLANFKDCRNLQFLDLFHARVTDVGLASFKESKHLVYLNLDGTSIGDAGMVYFQDCHNLEVLNLNGTYVGDSGLAPFKNCPKLARLTVSGKKITNVGLANFKDCEQLTHLTLTETQINDFGLTIFQRCPNLVRLRVARTRVTDAGLALLQHWPKLMDLDLGGNRITDAGLAQLPHPENLTYLDLRNTQVTDAGLARLNSCRNLSELILESTAITDAGLAHFHECGSLIRLFLDDTRLSDAGLEGFTNCKQLAHVTLTKTQVTQSGVDKLAAAVPGCLIKWDGNVIEPAAHTDIDRRAAEWVLSIGGTIHIYKNGEHRQIEALENLPREAFTLVTVILKGNQNVTDLDLQHLERLSRLTVLKLDSTRITDGGLEHVSRLTKLGSLNLSDTQIGDRGLALLERLNFHDLKLRGTNVTDAGLAYFKECKELETLDLAFTKVTDDGLVHFRECKNLRCLRLDTTQIGDLGLAHFKECHGLQEINLPNTQVTDSGLLHFKDLESVIHLNFGHTQVTAAGLANFKNCQNLSVLELPGTPLDDSCIELLARWTKLTTLDLRKTKVTEIGVKKLTAALPKCKISWDDPTNSATASPTPNGNE